jgi:NADPH:quinone reductase-like Zn-dependent oxidoreductase
MDSMIAMTRPGRGRSRTEATSLMKAIRYTRYGPPYVLRLDEVETPTPGCNDVLIRIHAAGVNAGDRILLRGAPFMVRLTSGLRAPKHQILGADVAGEITAVGSNVTGYQPGDAVFGDLSGSGYGAFAEYVVAPQRAVVLKPTRMTFEQAAAVPSAALTALQSVREAELQAGQQVLINGAAGGVGTFAVQIAKALGAEVTAVCSTRNLDMVRAIGADHVIDYTQEDYTRTGRRYDVMLDAAAYRPLSDNQRILAPGGVYVLIGGSGRQFLNVMLMGPWRSRTSGQRFRGFVKQPTEQNLSFVKELLDAGSVVPVIDRRYPLCEVPEALRYLEEGHARGKAVITMEPART